MTIDTCLYFGIVHLYYLDTYACILHYVSNVLNYFQDNCCYAQAQGMLLLLSSDSGDDAESGLGLFFEDSSPSDPATGCQM